MIDFQGQTAIVTGADRAVGRGLALLLASRGAAVLLVGRTAAGGQGGPEPTAAAIRLCGGKALALTADIDPEVDCIVEAAGQFMPAVDILINVGSDVRATARLTRSLWPVMLARGYGRVLNVFDESGPCQCPNRPAESRWAALVALTRRAARRGHRNGILVNALLPSASPAERPVRDAIPTFQPEWNCAPGLMAVAVAYFVSTEMPHTGTVYAVGGGRVSPLDRKGIASIGAQPGHLATLAGRLADGTSEVGLRIQPARRVDRQLERQP